MPAISIINQKGGCGKTTTAVNLSAALSAHRKNVLLIDMDPQGHASLALGVDPDNRVTVFDVLDGDSDRPMRDIIVKLSPTLHLAPSNIVLSALEQKLSGIDGRENRLRDKLASVSRNYDYIIIDCPPSLGMLTINALLSSDRLIVPVDASVFSLHGIEKLRETLNMIRNKLGHDPEVYGLATIFDRRTRFAKTFLDKLGEMFGENLYGTVIPSTIKFREAAQKGVSILEYAPSGRGTEAFLDLAAEMLGRDKRKRVKMPATKKAPVENKEQARFVTFALPDIFGARIVQLAGEFNNWDPTTSVLVKDGEGRWVTRCALKSGSYQYKYVVDGEWVLDPQNDKKIETDFGSVNSVITVK